MNRQLNTLVAWIVWAMVVLLTDATCNAQSASPAWGEAYGRACGFVGVDPNGRVRLEALVSSGNTDAIRGLLHSPQPVDQAYGVEGLLRLQHGGTVLIPADLLRIEELKRSEAQVLTCGGCTYTHEALSGCLARMIAELQN